MTAVAGRYGISDVVFKKKCAKAGIPTPDRGYWAKKEAGKPTTRTPLPKRMPGQDDDVVVAGEDRYGYSRFEESDLLGPLPSPPEFSEPVETLREKTQKAIGRVAVPREVRIWPDPIRRRFEEDEKRREKIKTLTYVSSWDKPIFESPFELRRFRILNALSVALSKVGGRLQISGKEARNVCFAIADQRVAIDLDIPWKSRTQNDSVIWSPRPADSKMVLAVDPRWNTEEARYRCEDDADGKIETKLTQIAPEIVVTAELRYREGVLHTYKWRVERKAQLEEELRKKRLEAERAERERQRKLEQARVDRLLRDADAFRQAQAIREYVQEIRLATPDPDTVSKSGLESWAQWALAQADRIDPAKQKAFLKSMDDEAK